MITTNNFIAALDRNECKITFLDNQNILGVVIIAYDKNNPYHYLKIEQIHNRVHFLIQTNYQNQPFSIYETHHEVILDHNPQFLEKILFDLKYNFSKSIKEYERATKIQSW